MPRELTGKADFTPRLTTRYEPYPNSVARQGNTGQSTSKILTYGVPPRNPPQTSSQPTSSQSNPIPISSDVEEDDLVFTHSIAPPSAPETRSTAIPTANNNMSTSRVRRQLDKVSNLGALMDTPEATHQQSPASEMAVVEESVTSADTTLLEHGEPILSDQQQQVLKRVLKGESIFFTGSAGVGKSVLTRAIIRALERKYPSPNQVAVTATTGIAATNVGGGTLHSWAGTSEYLGTVRCHQVLILIPIDRPRPRQDVGRPLVRRHDQRPRSSGCSE